jgi:signal peptidase I
MIIFKILKIKALQSTIVNAKWNRLLMGSLWIGLGILLANLIYSLGIELITVPSASMEKSIPAGKYVWINKLIPGSRMFPNSANSFFRLPGLRKIKRNDVVVFNFPDADTILANQRNESYHYLKRQYPDFDRLLKSGKWGEVEHLKVKQRPRMIKRVVAIPQDTIQISNGDIFVNGSLHKEGKAVIRLYRWIGNDSNLGKTLAKMDKKPFQKDNALFFELTDEQLKQVNELANNFQRELLEMNFPDLNVFPFIPATGWNADFMGPIYLPKKGDNIKLNNQNIYLYRRMISVFEGNNLEIGSNNQIKINGQIATQYTFKLNYYWVMGDNRPHSFDSRYWGPVPDNHIVGVVRK